MAVLDKRICEALSYADEVVDVKKDEAIESIVSAKKHINTLGPVKTVVVSGLSEWVYCCRRRSPALFVLLVQA